MNPEKTEKFLDDLVPAPIHAGRCLSVHSNVCNRPIADFWLKVDKGDDLVHAEASKSLSKVDEV